MFEETNRNRICAFSDAQAETTSETISAGYVAGIVTVKDKSIARGW
jgi:hypothetical protein